MTQLDELVRLLGAPNVLTGADAVAPYGGAAFHDNRVWLRKDPA